MDISFIIPTYNRENIIIRTLEAVACSVEHSQVNAEIIVIDNNSDDNTYNLVVSLQKECHVPIILAKEMRQGVNHARNTGLKLSRGRLIGLLDDDCIMHINFVINIMKHYAQDMQPVMRFAAVHLGDQKDWPMTIKTYPQAQRWQLSHPEWGSFRTGDIIGCCMLFPRDIYTVLKGLDPLFSTKDVPGGNDTEFGMRAYLADFKIEYVPDVIVYHFHGRKDEQSVRNLVKKYCIGGGAVYAKFLWHHPHIQAKISKIENQKDQRSAKICDGDVRKQKIGQFYKEYRIYFALGFFRYYIALIKKTLNKT